MPAWSCARSTAAGSRSRAWAATICAATRCSRGDVFLVPNRADLELWTGNAGGIEVIVDGAALAPLGDAGAVVREVPLDPPSLRARFGR